MVDDDFLLVWWSSRSGFCVVVVVWCFISLLFLRGVVREAFSILYRFNDHFPGKIFENIADFKLGRGVIFVKTGS